MREVGRRSVLTKAVGRRVGQHAEPAGAVGSRVGQHAVLAGSVGRRVGQHADLRAPSGEGSVSMLYWRAPSGEGSVSVLYWRAPSGEGSVSTLYWRTPSGEGSVSVLSRQAPSGEGSVSTLNSCRNDCARQFGSLTRLRTAETRGEAFGPGVFAIAFHFSAVRPSRRTIKPGSVATLLMTCAAASHGERGRRRGSAVRDRVRKTERCVARAHRGVGECGRPWSQGHRAGSRATRPCSQLRTQPPQGGASSSPAPDGRHRMRSLGEGCHRR